MELIRLTAAVAFLIAGHFFKSLRMKQFIAVYEKTSLSCILRSLSLGYGIDFFIPCHVGDIARSVSLGRKTENGFPFAFSTVIVDRFLDVAVMALIFDAMCIFSAADKAVKSTAAMYTAALGILIAAALFSFVFTSVVKKIILKAAGLFNSKIEFGILLFTWSFISSVKDIAKTISKLRLFINTVIMWTMYLLSYRMFADYFSGSGLELKTADVLLIFFSGKSLFKPTAAFVFNSPMAVQKLMYIVLPLVMIALISFIPDVCGKGGKNISLNHLLPQVSQRDRHIFLQAYFEGGNRSFLKGYIDISRGVSIIKDCSAGSNAVTMLCMNNNEMFFRKYAYSSDADKLYEQYNWMNIHRDLMPIAKTISCIRRDSYFYYDMPYIQGAEDFFNYIHTTAAENSIKILSTMLDDLDALHQNTRKSLSEEKLKQYISEKVTGNINTVCAFKEIKKLLKYKTLIINGREYKNMPEFYSLLSEENLCGIFGNDHICDIHGDLTIENIIITNNGSGYYLIDPNYNEYSSAFLDHSKLLQSLHGNYEFYMMTKPAEIRQNVINIPMISSSAYKEIYAFFHRHLAEKFSESELKSIYYHEIVHWLRLMPYKIRNDSDRAVNFYCAMIIVMNEVLSDEVYRHGENQGCDV